MNAASISAAIVAAAIALAAQSTRLPPDEFILAARNFQPVLTLHAQTSTVPISVLVRGSDGKLVGDLQRDDFDVLDNGVRQAVTAFSVERDGSGAEQPAPSLRDQWVLFYVDDEAGLFNTGLARNALMQAMRGQGPLPLHVAVVTASGQIALGFTHDRARVLAAAARIAPYHPPPLARRSAYQNLKATDSDAWEKIGDRSIIVLAAGFVVASEAPKRREILLDALRNGVAINSIDLAGVYTNIATFTANAQISELAQATGGRLIELNNDVAGKIRDLDAPPETRYRIAFTPINLVPDGSFHRLEVHVVRPGHYDIQSREGYIAPAALSGEFASPALQAILDRETLATDQRADLDAASRTLESAAGISVVLEVNPKSLAFVRANARNCDTVTVAAALLDPNGRFVAGRIGVMDLRLKDSSLRRLSAPGQAIAARLEVPAKPGDYRVRVVLVETGTNKTTTLNDSVRIP